MFGIFIGRALPPWDQALYLVAAYFGGLVSLLVRPVVWPVAGPLRLLAFMLGTASQETAFQPRTVTAEPNGSDSAGLFQWNSANPLRPPGAGDGGLTTAWREGWAFVDNIEDAILTDIRWFQLALPLAGFPLLRWLWTHGADDAVTAWTGDDTGNRWWTSTYAILETPDINDDLRRGWTAFLFARALTLGPLALLGWAVDLPSIIKRAKATRNKRK